MLEQRYYDMSVYYLQLQADLKPERAVNCTRAS